LDVDALVAGGRVFDLGRPMFDGMPQSPTHPRYHHALALRHGDRVRADGGTSAADLVVTGTHVGTHVDAIGHIAQDGRLHTGLDAYETQRTGRLDALGIDELEPVVCRGVLLDVPRVVGREVLDGAYEIGPDELEATATSQGAPIRPGDAVLVRTGWGRNFADADAFVGARTGAPGIGVEAARWLAERRVRLVGAETLAGEVVGPGERHESLPVHRVLLVDYGIHLVEVMDLDELAADAVHEFVFVMSPLRLVGATGSPVRPLALSFDR
jgi:kynurenine formamidase